MDLALVDALYQKANDTQASPADRSDADEYLKQNEESIVQAALTEMTKPDGTLQYPTYEDANYRNYLDSPHSWSSEKKQMVMDHSWLPVDSDRIGHCLIRLAAFRKAHKEANKSGAV